jgi:hypothetical protein
MVCRRWIIWLWLAVVVVGKLVVLVVVVGQVVFVQELDLL